MEFSEKIITKKEELLDEFEKLTLEELAIKIKQISSRETDIIFQIACLAARVSVLNKRIQVIMSENTVNDNLIVNNRSNNVNIVEKILKPSDQSNKVSIAPFFRFCVISGFHSETTIPNRKDFAFGIVALS